MINITDLPVKPVQVRDQVSALSIKRRLLFVSATAALVLGVGWEAAAFAYGPSGPSISTTTSTVPACDSIGVIGVNFPPNESIILSIPAVLGTSTSNSSGGFSDQVTIPCNTIPGPLTITAGSANGEEASTTVTVLASAPAVVTAATSGLAFTGADISAMAGVAAVAVGIGGALMLATRRRRAAKDPLEPGS